MRSEYDFKGGRPNPYARRLGAEGRKALAERFLAAEHLVRLDDDLVKAFPTPEAVNEALRLVLQIRESAPRPRRARSSARR